MSFEPCFDLNRIDDQSFRGSVLGMDFAYCDFAHLLSIPLSRPTRCSSIRRIN
jgi:hypothetical protein